MRTTLNIDDEVLKEAKIAAIREGITLTAYIERILRDTRRGQSQGEWSVPVRDGKEATGVSWDSISELIEAIEGPIARP